MTLQTSAIALFCEDIRDETSGGLSIIGVMTDNVAVPPMPEGGNPSTSKLCIYVRVNFDPALVFENASMKLTMPDGSQHPVPSFNIEAIKKARADVLVQSGPLVTIVSRIQIAPFVLSSLGRMRVEAMLGDESYLCGTLNFIRQGSA